MDYSDLPRRQRQSRYRSLASYEDGYLPYEDAVAEFGAADDDYQGYPGQPGAPAQRPPLEEPWPASAPEAGPSRAAGTGPFGAAGTGSFRAAGTGPFGAAGTGSFSAAGTGSFRAAGEPAEGRPAGRHARAQHGPRRGPGLLAGAVAGFLAGAVAIGVANLAAAFVRPQASPIIAVGGAFIDRTPPALKNFAVEKFGENDKNMLLLGMYVTIALIAIVVGMLARRRVAIGVAGIGLFGLFGAFVAITRPDSHVTDVIPSVVGGLVGIAAIVWLIRAGTRQPGYRSSAHDTGWIA